MFRYLGLLLLATTTACTYQVPVQPSPAMEVYSSYPDKIPGKFALYVDASSFTRTISATGQICSAHKYPVNANEAFKASVVSTFQQLVQDMQVVDAPLSRDALSKLGVRGMIVVKSDDYSARLMFVPGFWTATATASADISASIVVDSATERLFGTSDSASRSYDASTGGCDGGATALGQATGMAMKEMLGRMGERFANAPKLHQSNSQATVPIN